MQSIWDRANPQLRELKVYQPGKPIEETARELGCHPTEIVKLASNENPLGPSPRAVQAMAAALHDTHLYPDGGGYYLRRALAKRLQVSVDNVAIGNGSNELIELLAHGFLQEGDAVVTSEHAFVAYKIVARLFGAETIEAPSRNYGYDPDALLAAIDARTELVFIANPNNPTGTLLDHHAIDHFMKHVPDRVIVVFDEAYYEFLDDPPDTLRYVRAGRNVVTLRTFSKIHGLAGLRVGYAIARPELIEVMQKTREPFNVNRIGQVAALAALHDEEHQRETKRTTDEGREFFETEFTALGLPFIRSAGNFLLVNVGDGRSIFQALLRRKVIVRAMNGYRLPEWVRITMGSMEQNRKCISALRHVLNQ